ncbi:MAG: molybdopterin molybdotransferase MoeA [Acidobacteria bacterium]|nr:molybdopterin molybdotransferase MoeA [Acidobacteriota bacterium]
MVESRVLALRAAPAVETVPLLEAAHRVLAAPIVADRDYPPLARSIRDGFAVQASSLPGTLDVIGEVRAGGAFAGSVGAGQAVEIMTGAPVPQGADQVVMVEHTDRAGTRVSTSRPAKPGEFINPQAAEAAAGAAVVAAGTRLTFAGIAMLATTGHATVPVYARPTVAILATGDEIVPVDATPRPFEIRNSNAQSLAVQVARRGGLPRVLPVARDDFSHTRELVEEGLRSDLLLLSGGVSAGKYDLVEQVLAELGAEFYFDRVLIQPGQPLVFGRARGKFFFGLPGNPASTMVTFEIFARAAVELLGGQAESPLILPHARLTRPFRHQPGLTRFLPALLDADGGRITPIPWQGSSDVPSLARANAFLAADPDQPAWEAGDWIRFLPL